LEIAQFLVENEANMDEKNTDSEYSAFFLAAYVENLDIICYLANKGANKNATIKSRETVLQAMD
jgi:ankyrin repeat protein